MSAELVRYEEMRIAVETCARIDEASEIRDKSAALQAYARQRDDRDLEVWTAEIKLRACTRIGELVRELEIGHKAGQGTEVQFPSNGKLKGDAIADAGLSTSTAHRYEQLAGPRNQQAQNAGKAAAERYFATARAEKTPATMGGLRGAVREAVVATIGPPPSRKPKGPPPKKVSNEWVDWIAAVKHLANTNLDFETLAIEVPAAIGQLLDEAEAATTHLAKWLDALENADAE